MVPPINFSAAPEKSELVFDAEGNMVLQTVSTGSQSERINSAEATTTVDSATCGYDYAYRRPRPTKWTDEETSKFYEALGLYGSDQMLINTMLPHYSSVQIRQKFKAEQRNHPHRFQRILYGSGKKLSRVHFELQHGLILNPVLDHTTGQTLSLEDSIGVAIESAIADASAAEPEVKADDSKDAVDSLFS